MANNLENLGTNEFDIRRNKINTFQDSIKNYKQQDKENILLKRLILAEAESEGTLGMALVARSILNRHALLNTPGLYYQGYKMKPGTFGAKGNSLSDVMLAPGQYTPVTDGSINKKRTKEQLQQAQDAINMAKDKGVLMQALVNDRENKFGSNEYRENMKEIMTLVESTGFRNPSKTFRNKSQEVNMTRFGNHVFTTVANPYIEQDFLSEEEQRNAKPNYALPQPINR
tara:strand:- start:328 stop:1011 length:684 start_codon:yes stop_codon:yes gene_type:complete